MENIAICLACNANWRDGRYSDGCDTCGGGAMERPCPLCLGLCGTYWSRALLDSNDAGLAHWHGDCAFGGSREGMIRYAEAGLRVIWWLDDSALPEQIWACLITANDGRAHILDAGDHTHAFAQYAEAHAWLREDEYDALTNLRFDGQIPRDIRPPEVMVEQAVKLLRKIWPALNP